MSKLYILRPIVDWEPWYDKCFGVIVCAHSENEARQLATSKAGAEGEDVWLSADKTTCEVLKATNESKVIMKDFAAA